MKKIILPFAFLALLAASCQQEDYVDNNCDIEERAKSLGILSIGELPQDIMTRTIVQNNGDLEKVDNSDGRFIFFKARIAKASRNCLDGFGLCDIKFLKNEAGSALEYGDSTLDYATSIIKTDSIGNKHAYILMKNSPSNAGINQMPTFNIDEELEKRYALGDSTITIVMPAGQYNYDKTLGANGGYKIAVQTKSNTNIGGK